LVSNDLKTTCFCHYCTVDKIFDRTSFSPVNVSLLATSFTGALPSDVCNRIIEDSSSTARLECPLKCDSELDDCGGFGSSCYDYKRWVDSNEYGCDVYEYFGDAGCPYLGDCCPNDNGIAANDACCYCDGGEVECNTCFNTTDKGCTNDAEWIAIFDNETISCDWFEENDMPGCANTYITFLIMDNVSDPRESCCYCSEYGCQDVYGWHDVRRYDYGWGHGCDWYEQYDEAGCPLYGDAWPDDDGITAREACCHCHGYDPASDPPPACYDYNGWVDVDERGCHWYEYRDAPNCTTLGDLYPNEDGITANDACCYCGGGGSMNIPSASPSYQYKPSTTPSVTPTDKPTHQYEPTVAPSVTSSDKPIHQYEPTVTLTATPACYDYIGWVDMRGNGCDWYVENDAPDCPMYGGWYPKDGIFPNAACCYCDGGFALYNDDYVSECDDNDDYWQNIASTKYLVGNHQSCNELEYYLSILNKQTYDDFTGWTQFYCNDLNNGTVFMKDACCICNPNENNDDTKNDDDSSCVDIQIPKPWPQRNCEWFDESRCEEFGESTILIKEDENVLPRYANEICCICGGGTRQCHEFNDHWMDSHPDEPFNCDQYDSEERCAADGSGFISLGHTANTQCCVCGGGYIFRNDNVVVNAANKSCLDETNWHSIDLACSSFVDAFGAPDVEQCLKYGHIRSPQGVNASEGCCDCWYGYDVDTGGGYKGMLLGKMLRVGMMYYSDLQYVHNMTSSGYVDEGSTLYEFVRNASESYGFGLIFYDVKQYNIDRANDTYYACLNGELVNFS